MVATVISSDMDAVGQSAPNTKTRFVEVDLDGALAARKEYKARIRPAARVGSPTHEDMTTMDEPIIALVGVLHDYFDGLYDGDVEKLAGIYHERARLYCPTDPELLELDVETYLELVKNRPSPASRQDERFDQILELSRPTATTAHARVQCAYMPKRFTDDLTFVKTAAGWKIIAKVWHFEVVD